MQWGMSMKYSLKDRGTAVLLWIVCTVIMIPLNGLQLFHAILGAVARSHKMAVAIDECANSLLGGDPHITISCRVGEHLIKGEKWAIESAKFIDFFFGKNHCFDAAKNKE
jgi:hypothetical protein